MVRHTYIISADGSTAVEVDSRVGALHFIDTAHKETHEGEHYTVSHRWATLADDGMAYLRLVPHSTKDMHLIFEVKGESKCYIDLLEGTTYSGDGTVVTPYNNDRGSSNTAVGKCYHTPTVDAAGTVIYSSLLGAAGQQGEGGEGGSRVEWILKAGTDYLIRVQNKHGTAAKDFSIEGHFYEHDPE